MAETTFKKDNSGLIHDLIDKVLLVGTTIGVGVLLVSFLPIDQMSVNADLFIDIGGLSILFGTYYLRDSLSLKTKMNIINVILFILFISDLLESGLNTPDFILIVLIPFFSALTTSLRTGVFIFAVCSVAFLGIGHLFHLEIIHSPHYDIAENSIYKWYETLLMLSVVTFVITLFLSRFNKRVYNLIQNLEHQNDELVNTQTLIKENLNEKNVLLQEIHHRVKNNLAVVSGLLELQAKYVRDDYSRMMLGKSTNRILSIAKVHEMLYESKNFQNIPFETYILELAGIILKSMNDEGKEITVNTDIRVEELSINQGVPLGIIFNELITNSVKYGFGNKSGNEISISVIPSGEDIQVIYRDNGKGIEDFEKASSNSLGFTLVHSLMRQIEADYRYETDGKFQLSFTFPKDPEPVSFKKHK